MASKQVKQAELKLRIAERAHQRSVAESDDVRNKLTWLLVDAEKKITKLQDD